MPEAIKTHQHNKTRTLKHRRQKIFICDKAQIFILPNLYIFLLYSGQVEKAKKACKN